jgi:hypothetical protein
MRRFNDLALLKLSFFVVILGRARDLLKPVYLDAEFDQKTSLNDQCSTGIFSIGTPCGPEWPIPTPCRRQIGHFRLSAILPARAFRAAAIAMIVFGDVNSGTSESRSHVKNVIGGQRRRPLSRWRSLLHQQNKDKVIVNEGIEKGTT